MNDLWISRYQLKATGALNSKTSRRVYEGVLVRSGSGFGCLHPWPELGDPTLEECLMDLTGPCHSALVRRTMECVALDGAAREAGRSLFDGLTIPKSHATLMKLTRKGLEEAIMRGFTHVKVKVGRDLPVELEEVRRLMQEFPGLRWRVDFNGTGDWEKLVDLFSKWTEDEKGCLDFLEDPCVFDQTEWRMLGDEIGIPLANDRWMVADDGSSTYLVLKPAVDRVEGVEDLGQGFIVTSYLDHPLGQVYAALHAGRIGVEEVCGLQTHGVFEESEFSECLGEVRPAFGVPEGIGLGFGEILEKMYWVKMT